MNAQPAYVYPRDLVVQYQTDEEYRKCLRQAYGNESCQLMVPLHADVDDHTQDEWNYDSEAMNRTVMTVFQETRNDASFQELYKLAAGHFLSEELETGLCVLFSYDYFQLFHACLRADVGSDDRVAAVARLKRALMKT